MLDDFRTLGEDCGHKLVRLLSRGSLLVQYDIIITAISSRRNLSYCRDLIIIHYIVPSGMHDAYAGW